MRGSDLLVLLPLVILAAGAVLAMLAIAVRRSHAAVVLLTLITLAAAFAALPAVVGLTPRQVTPLLIMDRFALLYIGLLILASFAIALLAFGYWQTRSDRPEEFYALLLLAVLGAAVLTATRHFASFFLGLELLSVSLYGLIAYRRADPLGIEAAVKYLVLAGSSSALLLLGMALLYFAGGTMELPRLAELAAAGHMTGPLALAALGLIVVGMGFKLALVPFHLWTPDVYQGAPAPVSALVASVSKGAVFALLLRYFRPVDLGADNPLPVALATLSVASMLIGNLLALRQNNVKRILAYSSIAQMGYLLLPVLCAGSLAAAAATYYLAAYFITMIGAFGVVTVLSRQQRDADGLPQYAALAWRHPWLAAVLTAMLLSLAGMPLTAGFVAKFYLLAAGVQANLWLPAVVLVVSSGIGLYYYLRVVATMYAPPVGKTPAEIPRNWLAIGAVLPTLSLLLVWLGVYPAPWLRMIEMMVAGPNQ